MLSSTTQPAEAALRGIRLAFHKKHHGGLVDERVEALLERRLGAPAPKFQALPGPDTPCALSGLMLTRAVEAGDARTCTGQVCRCTSTVKVHEHESDG